MKKIENFSITPMFGGEETCSKLNFQGQDCQLILEGVALEAQFQTENDRYLLLLTDELPHEEQVHVYLLDNKCRVLDSLEIGEPYTTGLLQNIKIGVNDVINFTFPNEANRYRLRVMEKSKRSMFSTPVKAVTQNKGPLRKRYLQIEEA
ncbi:MAG: hypothetical protein OEZ68_15415 [Gammaproteobacteria bacterium]|nr:hypothetical protein [Gammaproteobacteria bacterium]MDH5802190.1 hypothetical protein [Gammaproteobacteria bacterium]